jgi:hypothetical protein
MNCPLEFVETMPCGKHHRLRCPVCGWEHASPYADPSMVHRPCPGACPGACRVAPHGPGIELTKIFKALGATPVKGCDCARLAKQMDEWGVDGCQEHREEILARLGKNYKQFTLTDKMKAAVLSWPSGIATKIKWSDPLPGLLDLALSRSKLAAEKSDNGGDG